MKTKLIIIILFVGTLSVGGYFYYQHNYVNTLMLSEIVGQPENDIVRLLVNFGDFDTGLTRHDINNLKSSKDYWINRIKEVETISDQQLQEQANIKLLADMMDDPTMKKIVGIISAKGFGSLLNILESFS